MIYLRRDVYTPGSNQNRNRAFDPRTHAADDRNLTFTEARGMEWCGPVGRVTNAPYHLQNDQNYPQLQGYKKHIPLC